jgi:activator of HSP90 ATPase
MLTLQNASGMFGGVMAARKYPAESAGTPTRRQMMIGAAVSFGGLILNPTLTLAADDNGISNTCALIRQEVVFKATSQRVYAALIDGKQFEKVIQLSAAVKSGAVSGGTPAQISPESGGAFTLFGGYITGRQIELVPNQRIVQAWRTGRWDVGVYSITRFEFMSQGPDTQLIFSHTGFPIDQAQHLAVGWKINYWEPLAKYLA